MEVEEQDRSKELMKDFEFMIAWLVAVSWGGLIGFILGMTLT